MGAEDNIKMIKTVYEAFGRGDVAAILESLTDDVDWAADTSSTVAPWYGVRKGKAAVADFFRGHDSAVEVQEFTPLAYGASDTEVFTLVRMRTKTRVTGVLLEMNLHHYFKFENSLIKYYRGAEDSAQTVAALTG